MRGFTRGEALALYRKLFRRLEFSPLDKIANRNLKRITKVYFKRQGANDIFRYNLGHEFLRLLEKSFIEMHGKSLTKVLDIAYMSKVNNVYPFAHSPPDWLTKFHKCNQLDLLNVWKVRRLAMCEEKGETVAPSFKVEKFVSFPRNKAELAGEYDRWRLEPLDEHKLQEYENIYAKVDKLNNFLTKAESKLHKKSFSPLVCLITLRYTGEPLPYVRERNIVYKRIKEVRRRFNEERPFNLKYFRYIDRFLRRTDANSDVFLRKYFPNHAKVWQRHTNEHFIGNPVYAVNKKLSPRFVLEFYAEYVSKKYGISDKGDAIYLDKFYTVPEYKETRI